MITGIWENEYIQELGIFDHCYEVLELKNSLVTAKAMDYMKEETKGQLARELMDLYLILEKWQEHKQWLKQKRIERFAEKAKENKE